MAVPQHPMSALKGTQQARDLMTHVRSHKKAGTVTSTGGGDFIKGAIKRPGALTAKAQAAGMSVDQFAEKHRHDPGVTGDEARFYLNVLKKNQPVRKPAAKPDELAVARQINARRNAK